MLKKILFASFLFLLIQCGYLTAQCSGFPATTADADCSGGTALANGANISSGSTGYCGSASNASFSSLNLNGGTLRICGNATLGFSSVNSGIIVVSCSATLTVNSSLTLNSNIGIINYGTIIINGSLTFQNGGNYVYNEMNQSMLTVNGDINFPTNNGTNGYMKNAGYIKVTGNYNAYAGAYTCFLNGGEMECKNLVYMDNNSLCNGVAGNRFTFGSSSGSCILRYTTNANLYNTFTSDNHWSVYQASGSTQTFNSCNSRTASWGSAVITASAPALVIPTSSVSNCTVITCLTTVLPIELLSFTATLDAGKVSLNWSTATETDNNYFTIEKSANGLYFEELTQVKGAGTSKQVLHYSVVDDSPYAGISYYRLKQTDNNGAYKYLPIISVKNNLNEIIITNIHPNPTTSDVDFDVYSPNKGTLHIQLIDEMGRVIFDKTQSMQESQSTVHMETSFLPQGIYTLHVILVESGLSSVSKLIKN